LKLTPNFRRIFQQHTETVDAVIQVLRLIERCDPAVLTNVRRLEKSVAKTKKQFALEIERQEKQMKSLKGEQRANGAYLGGNIPFGYHVVRNELRAVRSEQAMITQIVALRRQRMPLRKIKQLLDIDLSLNAISRVAGPWPRKET